MDSNELLRMVRDLQHRVASLEIQLKQFKEDMTQHKSGYGVGHPSEYPPVTERCWCKGGTEDQYCPVHHKSHYGALAGSCRRCGSRDIRFDETVWGATCNTCGYGKIGDRASISVVHDGLPPI